MSTGSKFHGTGTEPDSPAVVYAFGEAGSGAAAWKSYRTMLAGLAEVRAVRLPGRESRHCESPLGSVREQLDDLADEVATLVDQDERPFIVVGLCAGALSAFELARHLASRTGHGPAGLVVGGQHAPSLVPGDSSPVHTYSREEFRAWCETNLSDRPELGDQAAFEFFAPMLQADFSVVSSYRFEPLPLLACTVTAVCEEADEERTRGWAQTTAGAFTLCCVAAPVTTGSLVPPTASQLAALTCSRRPV
ncbi:thioesterase II family protein [Streptosporangium roseum]|uniref:thioesterase II family protein n=1 Tax=Streptosporangium roseum TaxID=2001 RepID=UPI003328F2B0